MSDVTLAVSEGAFKELFAHLRDSISDSTAGSAAAGPFSVSWNLGFRLENGDVELQNGGVLIDELDVVYDPVMLTLGLDLPQICVGGWCIVPNPFGGCLVRLPTVCVFSANPDIALTLDLGGLITSEISGEFAVVTQYTVDPGRTSAMTDLDAEDAGVPNKWQFFLDPVWLDVDLIDIADTVGNILDAAIQNAVNALMAGWPGWLRSAVQAVLGSLVDLVRALLDIGDDIDEWLSDLFNVSIGLEDFVLTVVADHFAQQFPIFEFEDPFPILDYEGALIPVKVPIENVAVTITTDEMVVSADVGA